MSRHIKSVDRHHLVGVGDEGFFCDDPAHEDWTRNCGEGVDTVALTRLPAVDLMSFHIYPAAWGKDLAWTHDWIARHVREADRVGKPVLWGEFGWLDKATRNTVYKEWTDLFDRPAATAGSTGSSPASRTTARPTPTTTASRSTARRRSARRCRTPRRS